VTLRFVPERELGRIRAIEDPHQRVLALATACRVNALYMIKRAGSGHIGTSFSAMELLTWLHAIELQPGDRAFSSKGHDAPGTYAVLTACGKIDFELIHRLRRLDGLPGHPDVAQIPELVTSTGSLGMGVSKARGFVLADRLARRRGRVFVLTGDGELQEGQFWESLQPTANRGLDEIMVIVDHNKLQSDTWVSEVSDLGRLEAKVDAFGWATARCDGHNVGAIESAVNRLQQEAAGRPQLLVADTIKGRGVSFMEPGELPVRGDSLYGYHSGAPTDDEYERGLSELLAELDERLASLGHAPVELEEREPAAASATTGRAERLVTAYGEALAQLGSECPGLVALDGDLALDTGLVPFRSAYPERFVECGIAEQDMVSMAGTLALAGRLPAVHSFACFLTPRANEQVYNNATEQTKVLYVGSLAGLLPAGPGHSHQSVRDIALMGSMPGMSVIEPYCELEAVAAVRWAVLQAPGPVYLRLISVPWPLGFEPAEVTALAPPGLTAVDSEGVAGLEPGRGTVLKPGNDAMLVCTGPVLISQAWAATERLESRGVSAGVVALPWLRDIDGAWLADVLGDAALVTIDNHYLSGGHGEAILSALAHSGRSLPGRVLQIGVTEVPRCGSNAEVLRAHKLDGTGIARQILALMATAAPSQ
jgi:transketolase